ncbi:hypothetical protein DV736_g2662, partial [Chaetothyriales sp. CBS 134916]
MPATATVQRSSYRSALTPDSSLRELYKAYEKSPRPKYVSYYDRQYEEPDRQPPPPPPSPVHWKKHDRDRH